MTDHEKRLEKLEQQLAQLLFSPKKVCVKVHVLTIVLLNFSEEA